MNRFKKLLFVLVPAMLFGLASASAQTSGDVPDYINPSHVKNYTQHVDGFEWVIRNLPTVVIEEAKLNFASLTIAQKNKLVSLANERVGVNSQIQSTAWFNKLKTFVQINMSAATYTALTSGNSFGSI